MTETIVTVIAFVGGLIAFGIGATLAIWGTSNNIGNAAGARLAGHFVAALAVCILVFSSYYITISIISDSNTLCRSAWASKIDHSHHANIIHQAVKPNNTKQQ